MELDVICKMGFEGYFLIVADFIGYARKNGVPVGPGRGSSAGSLVTFSLGITGVDPIEYDILFERFLNPERISMPDIDVDFCMRGRDRVIEYVRRKYDGPTNEEKRVAQIITFGKLQARAVLRDIGRVFGLGFGDVDRIAKLVPDILGITLQEAIDQSPELAALKAADPQVKRLLDTALALEGLTRHASTHAAGVVIGNRPLIDLVPLYRDPKSGEVVTQFDMNMVEKVGLVKFDFLGLRTLTIVCRRRAAGARDAHPDFSVASHPDGRPQDLRAALARRHRGRLPDGIDGHDRARDEAQAQGLPRDHPADRALPHGTARVRGDTGVCRPEARAREGRVLPAGVRGGHAPRRSA